MKNSKNTCSGKRKGQTANASAFVMVTKMRDAGLVRFVTRTDGQQGVQLTAKGQTAMWASDEGGNYDDHTTTA